MITVTLTPMVALALLYLLIGLLLLFAGIVERSSFTNPRYHETVIIAVIWPIWILQWPYYWVTGRYAYKDIRRLRKKFS